MECEIRNRKSEIAGRILSRLPLMLGVLCLCASAVRAQTRDFGGLEASNVWTGKQSFKNANEIRFADQFSGADAGAKIKAAISDLPVNMGGTVDARGLEGAQTIASDILSGVAKPVRLILGAATYKVMTSLTVPSDFTIEGSSGQTIIKKAKSIRSAFLITGSRVEIRGCRFEPQSVSGQPNSDIKLGEGSSDITIKGNSFYSPFATVSQYSAVAAATDSGVGGAPYPVPAKRILIADNTFEGYARPIFLHSVENITISRNFIKNTNFDAIRLRENDGYTIISDNQFENIGNPAWRDEQTRDAIDTYVSGTYLIISNNIVNTTACMGFDIKGVNKTATNMTERVIVTGNIIRNTRYSAIHVTGDTDYDGAGTPLHTRFVDVSHNQVYSCNQNNARGGGSESAAGIEISAPTMLTRVTDNTVAFCYGRGIDVGNGVDTSEQSRNLIVSDNIVVNNGYSGRTYVGGIVVIGIDGLILRGNVAINDPSLNNPYQGIGIAVNSTSATSPVSHMQIVTENIARGNLTNQIVIGSNNNRATGLAALSNNLQEGRGAIDRPTWQNQRGIFHGNGSPPAAADGEFRQGDIILNDSATATSHVGLINTATGSPGTWVRFGSMKSISADNGDAGATLTVGTSETTQRWNTPLTADRSINLSTSGSQSGDKFRIVREAGATGRFNLNVGSGPLKALSAAGEWCDVEYDGSAWRLTACGSL